MKLDYAENPFLPFQILPLDISYFIPVLQAYAWSSQYLVSVNYEIIPIMKIGRKNRFCEENTRLIADVIEYCKIYKHPCIILLIDFEKAFDTVRWSFLYK